MRRVAITGIGIISSIGKTTDEFWRSLAAGRTGIRPIVTADMADIRFKYGAEISDYSSQPYFEEKRADFLDRFAQFAVIAAREAVAQAHIDWNEKLRETAAIITGSCIGGQSTEDTGFQDVYRLARNRVHPLTIPKTMANAGASHISMEFGITGACYTIAT